MLGGAWFRQQITLVGVGLLSAVLFTQSAGAQDRLVAKAYKCPQGQAAATADTLRNDYGVIPGVRVAVDERTSQVIVQAPPEVQARISQRMATAYPDLQPPAEKATASSAEVRQIALQRVQPEQLDAALWSTVGNRLTAVAEQRAGSRGYHLTMTGGGVVTLWIDAAAKQVKLEGPATAVDAAARLIRVLDSPQDQAGRNVRLMPLQPAQLASVERAASVIRAVNGPRVALPLAALLMQRPETPPAGGAAPSATPPAPGASPGPGLRPGETPPDFANLARIVNPVQMEVIEGLDMLVLRGSAQDVEELMRIVRIIEAILPETEPAIEILSMKHVDCQSLANTINTLYVAVYQDRQGTVNITPLVTPNALLIVGRKENVGMVKKLAALLDQPAVPGSQFQVFHLRYASAATVKATIDNFFAGTTGGLSPGTRVVIVADARTSSLIVQASPRDMAEVAEMIRNVDVINIGPGGPVNEMRIFQLEHTLATDIAQVLQAAITGGSVSQAGQQQGQGGPFGGGPFGQAGQQPGQGQAAGAAAQRASMLHFFTLKNHQLLKSGILTEVRITPDPKANALLVSSPPENFDLLAGLIHELDTLPAAEAQLKVFTIQNGDATNLQTMLQNLFTTQTTQQGQQGGGGFGPFGAFMLPQIQTTSSASATSLVPLRFGVDTRTNSVIVSGTEGDLIIVEAILTKLDDSEIRHRKSVVIRLKNSPSDNIASTITTFLSQERTLLQQAGTGLTSAFEQVEREVIVVSEPVTNSLVLSATPRYFEEVRGIIEQLDARPAMVMIQVMIVSITLGSTNEFGIELGLQDSVLFDRSIISSPIYSTTTLPTGTSTQTVVAANQQPGFAFNNGQDLGNSIPPNGSQGAVGSQGIANFGVSRTNSTLGYSGLVLSAASENVSAMLRALSENHRIDILQRPTITTLDNQPAKIQVGQNVPQITGVTTGLTGTTNNVTPTAVGLILGVTPRISPDGLVVMQIDAEKSELESETTGIPIFVSTTGQVSARRSSIPRRPQRRFAR